MSSSGRPWEEELRALGRQRADDARSTQDPTLARLLELAAEDDNNGALRSSDPLAAATLAAGALASGLAGFAPSPASDAMDAPLRAVIERVFESFPDGPPQTLQQRLFESRRHPPLDSSETPR